MIWALIYQNKLIFKTIERIYRLKPMILRTIKKYLFLSFLLFIAQFTTPQDFVTPLLEGFSYFQFRLIQLKSCLFFFVDLF